jgi:hypothetical protein
VKDDEAEVVVDAPKVTGFRRVHAGNLHFRLGRHTGVDEGAWGGIVEDLTLALVTLTSFVLLFVVAIFADRAGAELELDADSTDLTVLPDLGASHPHTDVA